MLLPCTPPHPLPPPPPSLMFLLLCGLPSNNAFISVFLKLLFLNFPAPCSSSCVTLSWPASWSWSSWALFFSIIFLLLLVGWDYIPRYCSHFWPIVQTPDDRWGLFLEQLVEWRLAGETEILGENLPQRHFVHSFQFMPKSLLAMCYITINDTQNLKVWTQQWQFYITDGPIVTK
jgi:hypothetical protein